MFLCKESGAKMREIRNEIVNFKTGQAKLPTVCRFTVYETDNKSRYVVLLTELSENPGMSVTNASEEIATKIYNEIFDKKKINPEQIVWLEKYDTEDYYDRVSYDVDGSVFSTKRFFSNPQWKRMSAGEFEALINEI